MNPYPPEFQTCPLDADHLDTLLREEGGQRMTVYLPIATEAPDSEQNPILLKDLLKQAEDGLAEEGMTPENIEAFLHPARALQSQPERMLRHASALGLFMDETKATLVDIPYRVEASCRVGNRFHMKPLLPLIEENPSFTVLCLERENAAAYRGSRVGLRPVDVPDMPRRLEDVTWRDDPEESTQHHAGTTVPAPGAPGRRMSGRVHGQGVPDDLREQQVERFFHQIAEAMEAFLAGKSDPLVLFGVEANIGSFERFFHRHGRTVLHDAHSAHDRDVERLRDAAWEQLASVIRKREQDELERLTEAVHKGEGVREVSEAAMAAAMGRLDCVAVANDEAWPGICSPDTMEVREIVSGQPACAHDLLDFIAAETIRHGGRALAMPAADVPGRGSVAATTRY